jgi:uncharacterized protein (DUF4415 family)
MKNRKLIRPTDEENRAINAGIAADPDTYQVPPADFRKMRPFRVGRPKSENPKEHVNLRLDPKVLEFFRSGGPGWQTRVNDTLLKYVARQLAKG